MSENKFTLPKFKNAINGDQDINLSIELKSNNRLIQDNDYSSVISLSELYQKERDASTKYIVNGKIEILSNLFGVPQNYDDVTYFFDDSKKQNISFSSRFEIYLCYFHSLIDMNNNVIDVENIEEDTEYIKRYSILTNINDVVVSPFSFSKNIFNEPYLYFNFNKLFDLNILDGYQRPLHELYVYLKFKPLSSEVLYEKTFDAQIEKIIDNEVVSGSLIKGKKITIDKENYQEIEVQRQEHRLVTKNIKIYTTYLKNNFNLGRFSFNYEPLFTIPIINLSDYIENSDINSTDVIPDYAFKTDTQAYWRDLGLRSDLNYPFTDNNHYIFKDILLTTMPDMKENTTASFFNKFTYNVRRKNYKIDDDFIEIC